MKRTPTRDTNCGIEERRLVIRMVWVFWFTKIWFTSAFCIVNQFLAEQSLSQSTLLPAKGQVYAPTTDHSDEELEHFYKKLEHTTRTVPRNNALVVMNDCNAKVGADAYENWAGTVENFALGDIDEKGLR